MLERLTSKELSEYEAYFRIKDEPAPTNPDAAVSAMKAAFGGPKR